jgi:flagellar basal-body rod protein FlgG
MRINLTPLKQAMVGQLERNDVVANNLANLNTMGFKKDLLFFDLVNGDSKKDARSQLTTDFTQGALKETDNPLDFALSGKGFFTVQTSDGPALTRDGHFKLDGDGILRTQQGFPVLGESGQIILTGDDLNPKDITVTENGEIYLGDEYVDRLLIQDVEDHSTLKKVGANLFVMNDQAEPQQLEKAEVHQGFVEGANVNPAEEMIQLIEIQRKFESMQRMVRAWDETFRRAANDVGKYY